MSELPKQSEIKAISTPQPEVKAEAPSAAQILELLQKVNKLESKLEAKPNGDAAATTTREIDWSQVTEAQVSDLNFPIPVYEHEIPEYMTVFLNDNNYVAKWIHTMPRRLGAMLAEGYEYVTKSDWDSSKPQILSFNSEGHLIYDDVVALKIHKSRYFGKVRRDHLKSTQLRNVAGYNKVKGAINQAIANNPAMESAVNRGAMTFYGEEATSNIEQISI